MSGTNCLNEGLEPAKNVLDGSMNVWNRQRMFLMAHIAHAVIFQLPFAVILRLNLIVV
jgi:hypothetical protein